MSARDPVEGLLADLKGVPPAALPTRVADSRAAAVAAIDALPDGPCRTTLVAWLQTVDDESQEWLRAPAASYGRLWIAASTAYQPPSAATALSVQVASAPTPAPAPPAATPEIFIGDPRDHRPALAPRAPGVRLPPMVKKAPPPPPAEPRRVPQGRPPYVPMRDRPAHRPLGPAPDDDDIPF